MRKFFIVLALVALAVFLFIKRKTIALVVGTYWDVLSDVLMKLESFSSTPYWDFKQWSWGYGSRVPGSVNDKNVNPGGTITKAAAILAALTHVKSDKAVLEKMIKVDLNSNQWAALLSFSYNEGVGNADNLVANVNKQDWPALFTQMRLYNKVTKNGVLVVDTGLVKRREYEIALFQR